MCGLFGFFHISNEQKLSEGLIRDGLEALRTLSHRGPDDEGHYADESAFIGHRRLSIIDLSHLGHQPMVSEDGRRVIAVNGEIYNFQSLRQEIGETDFRSRSDSEVILHGYDRWGAEKLMKRADGMYAGVIYDNGTQTLHLFRDRAGIKPLYYGKVGKYFVWSSELKAIKCFARRHGVLEIDPTAVLDFAANRYIPAPKTIYKDIFKLLPAHILSLNMKTGAQHLQSYWNVGTEELPLSDQELAERIRCTIDQSVQEQLVSDVPIGFCLSGGIDSSIITTAASNHTKNVHTFSIGFDIKEHDETRFAQIVADKVRSQHWVRKVGSDQGAGLFSKMNDWYDEPFGDTSALPTFHVCDLAKQHCTVALSGDGGDELFGGYKWYKWFHQYQRLMTLASWFSKKPSVLPFHRPPRNIVEKITNRLAIVAQQDSLCLYSTLMSNLLPWELAPLREELEIAKDYDVVWALRKHWRPELGPLKSLQYLDFHTWLPDDILTKVDRVSMAVSLEVRVPFLSKKVIELAFSLPEKFTWHQGKLKGGLKFAYTGLLPQEIVDRKKKGFSIPKARWGETVLGQFSTYQMAHTHQFLDQEKYSQHHFGS